MNAPECYYVVKARTSILNKESGEIEFRAIERKFSNDNPVEARKEAFRFRSQFIRGMLHEVGYTDENIGWNKLTGEIEGISDKEIRKLINPYLEYDSEPGLTKTSVSDNEQVEKHWYPPDDSLCWYGEYNNGIWVLMFHNDNDLHWDHEMDIVIDKLVKYREGLPVPPLYNNLKEEYQFYKKHNFDIEDFETDILFFDDESYLEGGESETEALKSITILKTPFDWTGYDKPFWWELDHVPDSTDKSTSPTLPITMQVAYNSKEHKYSEFKPGLLNVPGLTRDIELEIAQSLCAFLNSGGGYLFIGLDDNGNPYNGEGLIIDNKDKFLRDFTTIKTRFLPPFIAHTIYGDFYLLRDKEIFVVTVFPSEIYPIFLRQKDKNGRVRKEFYVRSDAGSRHIYDTEEVLRYCRTRWK